MNLRNRASGQLGAVLAMCSLAVACSSPAPAAPVASSAPPSSARPSSSPTETQIERQRRLDFEAAEKSYRAFHAEYTRLTLVGGASAATDAMKDHAAGPYLKSMTSFLETRKRKGWGASGEVRIVYVRADAYGAAKLSLNVCEDGSHVQLLNKAGKPFRRGSIGRMTLSFRSVEGQWKVWSARQTLVASCGT